MNIDEETRLIEKLRKIELLFARSPFSGEQAAAETAADRIRLRIRQLEQAERTIEFRFSLPDSWSKALFTALLRRYNLSPYRYSGQRRTTVMVKVTETFVNEVLWPEFQELNETLRAHLDSVTSKIIKSAIDANDSDVEERTEQAADKKEGQSTLSLG